MTKKEYVEPSTVINFILIGAIIGVLMMSVYNLNEQEPVTDYNDPNEILNIIAENVILTPQNRIVKDDVLNFKDKIVINKEDIRVVLGEGISMSPTLGNNNILLMVENKNCDISRGDIVSYRKIKDGVSRSTTHRIVDIHVINNTKIFYTQGDNSPSIDSSLNCSQIQYIAVGILY